MGYEEIGFVELKELSREDTKPKRLGSGRTNETVVPRTPFSVPFLVM